MIEPQVLLTTESSPAPCGQAPVVTFSYIKVKSLQLYCFPAFYKQAIEAKSKIKEFAL